MNRPKRRKKNKSHRRSASHRAPTHKAFFRKRRRKSNPGHRRRHAALRAPTHKKHYRRRGRRSGNPFFGGFTGMLGEAAFLVGGGIGTRSLPALITGLLGNPGLNTGIVGYLMNLVSATALSWAVGRWKGPAAARSVMLGGVVFTASRIFDDYTGEKLVSFAQVSPSAPYISGDSRYGIALAGAFADLKFVLPTSTPSVNRQRAIAAAAPARSSAPALHAGF